MDELEVFFCDLCGTSVPENDLDRSKVLRLHGKIVGTCCLEEVRSPKAATGASRRWLSAALLITFIAVGGAVAYLDWRSSEQAERGKLRIERIVAHLETQNARLDRLQARLVETASHDDWQALEVRAESLGSRVSKLDGRIIRSMDQSDAKLQDLMQEFGEVRRALDIQSARISGLREQSSRVSRDVERLLAMPRGWDSVPASLSGPGLSPHQPVDSRPTLPPELARLLSKLSDEDSGTRFETVDELFQSEDDRVFAHILPLASDPDPFVRRLVIEGLSGYRVDVAVDALLLALDDAESLVRYAAVASLKKLTGQKLRFDAEASTAKRSAMRKRWQNWWSENKSDFF